MSTREASTPPSPWHALDVADVLHAIEGSEDGLSAGEVDRRRLTYGPNRLTPPKQKSALVLFLLQFHNVLIYVLLASGAVKLFLGDFIDASVIFGVVIINAIIGLIQEGKAEKSLAAIRNLLSLNATVFRDGQKIVVPAEDLVPGDIVFLQSGDKVPADLRLTAIKSLKLQEAVLTGESVPVEKSVAPVDASAALGDRSSMAFSGTLVTYGQGTGVVVAAGDRTEIGRIGTLLSQVEGLTTPLLQQIAAFSSIIAVLIIVVAAAVFATGYFIHGFDANEMFSAAIGFAVAAIPEGLPAVMTITLAIGVQKMARHNAIIRRLPAVETLGSVSVICSDKTGTMTRNEMMVESISLRENVYTVTGEGYEPLGEVHLDGARITDNQLQTVKDLCRGALLCNDAIVRPQVDTDTWQVDGDPMEGALLVLAMKVGLDPANVALSSPRLDVIPFESEHKFMATLHHDHCGGVIFVKGAPERVFEMCAFEAASDGSNPFDSAKWLQRVGEIGRRGQRVLALARKDVPAEQTELSTGDVERQMTLLGLFGLADPPDPKAVAAVAECQQAGIRVKMITGDHADTARSIAKEFQLTNTHDVITGHELDEASPEMFAEMAMNIDVFARTTPEHKLRLVEALQKQGTIVAMTGDGVNDAPALKQADIGIAMGQRGSEAAKEAAQMVLADDSFASIAHAVEEGRTVYDNLRKAILFLLATNGAQALTMFGAVLAGTTLPITAVQILWVNMVVAVTLGLALSFEPSESNVMARPPRRADAPLVSLAMLWRLVFVAVFSVVGVFVVFHWELTRTSDVAYARTAAVNVLVACAIFYLFSARKDLDPAISARAIEGILPVLISVASIIAVQLLFTYAPLVQDIFHTRPLETTSWLMIVGFGLLLLLAAECEKAIARRVRGRAPA
jgi:magnesium-transporting ATPase (P-type)